MKTWAEFWIEVIKIIISVLGFGGTICALYFGFRQYKRAEQWKRAEFVSKEIKEFESDICVVNAMYLIDWGERRVNLFHEDNKKYEDYVKITREIQWRALLPHTIKVEYPSLQVESESEKVKRFTPVETKIRDTYDEFLKYLQRFGNFVESDLVLSEELKPYLYYWIQSIAQGDTDKDEDLIEDNNWRYVLLCYINFYNYSSVIRLFNDFGFDISPEGTAFKDLECRKIDKKLYEKMQRLIKPKLKELKSEEPKKLTQGNHLSETEK